MKRGTILENIEVEKLVFGWKWFARLKSENPNIDGKALFISGWAIPWAIVNTKVVKKRKDYYDTQMQEVIKKSPLEKKHPNNLYGDMAWAKWVNIPYLEQLKIKQSQVEESLFHIKKLQENINIHPITPSPLVDGYRNKVEFSYWKYISAKYDIEQHFNVGFHKQWEFSKIEDFDGCILIDDIQNTVYKEIKDFSKTLGLPVFDQKTQKWFFRHILIRRAFFTDEMMIIFSFNHEYLEWKEHFSDKIELLKTFFWKLTKKHTIIKSVYFSHNSNKADIAIWELALVYGKETISEKLLWIEFEISPTSFFQTNSYGAEKLYSKVLEIADKEELQNQTVLDLYGGTGTIWMIFAWAWAKHVTSVELVESASRNWEANAKHNNISNIDFICDKVENFLDTYLSEGKSAELLIIDPPRAGMHPKALPNILQFQTNQIIYVSCNPATLSRDLHYILDNSDYKIEWVYPVDMFPHTHHIEVIVNLKLAPDNN
jgi:23S rRNA (uracil1939-C5)-methyltransferase